MVLQDLIDRLQAAENNAVAGMTFEPVPQISINPIMPGITPQYQVCSMISAKKYEADIHYFKEHPEGAGLYIELYDWQHNQPLIGGVKRFLETLVGDIDSLRYNAAKEAIRT